MPRRSLKPPKPPVERLDEKVAYIKANRNKILPALQKGIQYSMQKNIAHLHNTACILNELNVLPLPGRECWSDDDVSVLLAYILKR